MCIEVNVVISGLADDHRAVEDVLLELVRRSLSGATVFEPVHRCDAGFEFILAIPAEQVSNAVIQQLRDRLAASFDQRGILHADLHIEAEESTIRDEV